MAASITKTILTNSGNWEDWNNQFTSHAIMYHLLGHVEGKEELLPKPVKPAISNFAQKTRQTPARRLGLGSAGQEVSQDQTPEPDLREVAFSDLTADGQKSFSMAWTFYQDEVKAYEKQQDLLRKFKEWIAANVSSHYQKTCCKPTESLTKWYENLKKAAGISKRLEDANARQRYREALRTPKIRDLSTWADSWEQAMTIAKDKEVLATSRASEWFEDFLIAIKGILPTWSKAYGINKDPQVEDNTLDYRTVANDLRRVASQYARTSNLGNKLGKIAKGSFGPTFAGEEYQHAGNEPKRGNEDATGKKRGRPSKGKQGNEVLPDYTAIQKRKHALDEASGKVCRACERFHETQRCFYLFPNKAPEEWTPKPHIQTLVKQNLVDDSTLGEEVKRWTRQRGKEKEKRDE